MLETLSEFFNSIFYKKKVCTLNIEENLINNINQFILCNDKKVLTFEDDKYMMYTIDCEYGSVYGIEYNICLVKKTIKYPVYKCTWCTGRGNILDIFNLDEDILKEMMIDYKKLFEVK